MKSFITAMILVLFLSIPAVAANEELINMLSKSTKICSLIQSMDGNTPKAEVIKAMFSNNTTSSLAFESWVMEKDGNVGILMESPKLIPLSKVEMESAFGGYQELIMALKESMGVTTVLIMIRNPGESIPRAFLKDDFELFLK